MRYGGASTPGTPRAPRPCFDEQLHIKYLWQNFRFCRKALNAPTIICLQRHLYAAVFLPERLPFIPGDFDEFYRHCIQNDDLP